MLHIIHDHGAEVPLPAAYVNLPQQVRYYQSGYQAAVTAKNTVLLAQILSQLQVLQQSIANITPAIS